MRAVVRDEVVLGVLGGDAALQRMGADADVRLRRHAALGRADARAAGDADLRLHQVDAGGALGDGVLDLDARVDLDEVEAPAVGVLQELHRAGVARSARRGRSSSAAAHSAARCASSRNTAGARSTTFWLRRCTVQSRSYRCTRLPWLSPRICTSTWRARRTSFSRYTSSLPKAACASRRATRQHLGELRVALDHAHAAPAPAPARLEHHRVADALRQRAAAARSRGSGAGRGHHGHARRDRKVARRDLVAEHAHGVRARADEDDAGRGTRLGELGVLGEETVARVHRVHPGLARHPQDVLDVEVGLDRALAARPPGRPRPPWYGAARSGPRASRSRPCAGQVRWPPASRGWRSRRGWRPRGCGSAAGGGFHFKIHRQK